MNASRHDRLAAYVDVAAALSGMSLRADRVAAVTTVMMRLADFAADLSEFELTDEVDVTAALIS